jgi:hypothetical protein
MGVAPTEEQAVTMPPDTPAALLETTTGTLTAVWMMRKAAPVLDAWLTLISDTRAALLYTATE